MRGMRSTKAVNPADIDLMNRSTSIRGPVTGWGESTVTESVGRGYGLAGDALLSRRYPAERICRDGVPFRPRAERGRILDR